MESSEVGAMEEKKGEYMTGQRDQGVDFTNTKLLLDQLGFRLFIHHFDYLPT